MLYVNPMVSPYNLHAQAVGDDTAQRRIALQELEHYFVYTLLQEMRKSIPEGGLFAASPEKRVYEEMLDDAYSAEIARSGQMGIARMIEEQLRIEELQHTLRAERGL